MHPIVSTSFHRLDLSEQTSLAIQAWLSCRDQQAAAWLVRSYEPAVQRAVSRLPHWWLRQDAVQDTFHQAFAALHRYRPESPFVHWLSVIARHTCFKHIRTLSRRAPHLLTTFHEAEMDHEACLACLPSPERPADELLCLAEQSGRVLQAVESLPERIRQMFEQQLEGISADEIASRHRMKAGAVRVTLSRARKAVRLSLLREENASCTFPTRS